ncbi:hypothetical protein [Bacillus sp. ISL-39]|uniref:hypothetical protein n=1 Tax=Bacillus sp. ISL-39 TaxID=2819124 RepID=UPI001BEBBC96|nr:hypothetical protein [Bacillus sp. ISL-39]MBT2639374.1 hypothetical protein [Bacillus sp. ISL-39]
MSKDLKLAEIIQANKKVHGNISAQLKEIDEKLQYLQLPSFQLDPEVTKALQKLNETAKSSAETFAAAFQRAIKVNMEFTTTIPYLFQKMVNSIGEGIREGLRARLEEYEEIMGRYDKELWAVDQFIFDNLNMDENPNITFKMIESIVEENLPRYMDLFKKDNVYCKYASIIDQAYCAYRSEQYALASFPLFAVIEGLISTTFHDYKIDLTLKPQLRYQKNKLYAKLSDYVESKEDELAINLLFFRRVFYVYQEVFKPSWDAHPEHINRNWVMHGSFNYESISKKDVLRLFQMVKALEIIKYISFEKVDQ